MQKAGSTIPTHEKRLRPQRADVLGHSDSKLKAAHNVRKGLELGRLVTASCETLRTAGQTTAAVLSGRCCKPTPMMGDRRSTPSGPACILAQGSVLPEACARALSKALPARLLACGGGIHDGPAFKLRQHMAVLRQGPAQLAQVPPRRPHAQFLTLLLLASCQSTRVTRHAVSALGCAVV